MITQFCGARNAAYNLCHGTSCGDPLVLSGYTLHCYYETCKPLLTSLQKHCATKDDDVPVTTVLLRICRTFIRPPGGRPRQFAKTNGSRNNIVRNEIVSLDPTGTLCNDTICTVAIRRVTHATERKT